MGEVKERKHSKKRDAILKTIRNTTSHPSAEWVYSKLKHEIPNISLGTVYRNIAQFKEEGRVIAVANVNGIERVDGNTAPHAHFVCNECGSVFDIWDIEQQVDLDKLAQPNFGGKITSHSLVYYGVCEECLNSKRS